MIAYNTVRDKNVMLTSYSATMNDINANQLKHIELNSSQRKPEIEPINTQLEKIITSLLAWHVIN